MGRSVSVPTNAHTVCYRDVTTFEFHEDWYEFVDDIRREARQRWPSMTACDVWLDREDHAILENTHAYIGVSEYCGIASVWLVSKGEALADAWCDKICNKFRELFKEYELIAVASNGEALFDRVAGSVVD